MSGATRVCGPEGVWTITGAGRQRFCTPVCHARPDLTEHNPNVLFELDMRISEDKPVVLVRSKGTGRIFDVDQVLRVEEYSPNLWTSTLATDQPRLETHIKGAWDNRNSAETYRGILTRHAAS
jgi:hypothetical protein